ncbi:hypothetical protein Vretimale_10616 [Volvox reticuliferus]|uniref:Peptidase M43 pregnancy-associated plasma-A domain-containing protein n=1 Tax=Volvox reticuliferus TaxID=1737510 RepID=A0A8J4GFX8_9CHLO|nr:hypothetical protein Vretimale_10616 [Volvox reticuliferus]
MKYRTAVNVISVLRESLGTLFKRKDVDLVTGTRGLSMATNPVYSGSIVIEKAPSPPIGNAEWKKTCASRWFKIAVVIMTLSAAAGIGVGVGVNQAKKKKMPGPPAKEVSVPVLNMTYVKNKLLPYVPVNLQEANTNELIDTYLTQISRLEPVAQLLANVLPAMGLNATAIQPQAIQILLQSWFESNKVDASSLAATLDSLAQLAQGVLNFQSHVLSITSNLCSVVGMVRQRLEAMPNSTITIGGKVIDLGGFRSGLGGRRSRALMQQGDVQALIKKRVQEAVNAVLSSPAAAPYVNELRSLYDPEIIPDLVFYLYDILIQLAAESDDLRDIMSRLDGHFDLEVVPSIPIYDPKAKANLSTIATPVPYDKRTVVALSGPARRRLLQSEPLQAALLRTKLPPTFKPANGSVTPKVLVPLVFHIMSYRQQDGYGPPNFHRSPEYVDRLMNVVNAMALPTKFQFFLGEIRYDPEANPYLVRDSRFSWMGCASRGNYLYKECGDVLLGQLDHPRSINVFVAGDRSNASFAGYGWVPSSPSNITSGHVALLWSVVDVNQWNSQAAWEYGAKVMWHEIMHHLGLYHTFGRSSGNGAVCSAGSDDGIQDTPIVAGPVYEQRSFATTSRSYCLDVFSKDLGSSWDYVLTNWRTRLGIPPADASHGFDSCPNQYGNDELGNYITYTHDVCIAALGHATEGQTRYMHNFADQVQQKLYMWGQYFAALTPAAFKISPRAANPAALNGPCMATRGGCRCKASWSFKGQQLNGCSNPDGDEVGLWCPVEQDGNCQSAINGYWDYCVPEANSQLCTPELFRSPPLQPARPPAPQVPCGPDWTTVSGSVCASEKWAIPDENGDYETAYLGCANPDDDPAGSWCRLKPGFTTLTGRNWDYCGPRCANFTGSSNAPYPPPSTNKTQAPPPGGNSSSTENSTAICATVFQGLPGGCSCRAAWGLVLQPPFASTGSLVIVGSDRPMGRRYTNARYCTVLPELQPPLGSQTAVSAAAVGVCETTNCLKSANNGRIMVCGTPCTVLKWEDGEDILL